MPFYPAASCGSPPQTLPGPPLHRVGTNAPAASRHVHDVTISNAPSSIAGALNAEWQDVVTHWIAQGAATLSDQSQHVPGVPLSSGRWQAFLAEANGRLPADLSQLSGSESLCQLFGLDQPLPEAFRSALLLAATEEARQSTREGTVDARSARRAVRHIEQCVLRSAREAIVHPDMQPLFNALHRRTTFGAGVERVENRSASDAARGRRE